MIWGTDFINQISYCYLVLNLIEYNGSHYRMEKPYDDVFESICDIEGHLFIDNDKDILPEEPDDDLFKWCFVCDGHIKFWHYSPEMIVVLKSKELCC